MAIKQSLFEGKKGDIRCRAERRPKKCVEAVKGNISGTL